MSSPIMLSTLEAALFTATVNGRWQPGIGDPTPMGWITTLTYALTGFLCLFAAMKTLRNPPGKIGFRATLFWACSGFLMLFLAVNKQLDLQTLFTDIGRQVAIRGGWYETRQVVQTWFIRGLAAGGLLALGLVAWLLRGARLTYYLALVGLVFTGCFVVIRAASFHHVDALIGYQVAGIRMNWVFELGGILVVAASALAYRERIPEPATPKNRDEQPDTKDVGDAPKEAHDRSPMPGEGEQPNETYTPPDTDPRAAVGSDTEQENAKKSPAISSAPTESVPPPDNAPPAPKPEMTPSDEALEPDDNSEDDDLPEIIVLDP